MSSNQRQVKFISQTPHEQRDRMNLLLNFAHSHGIYPYFRTIEKSYGTEVDHQGRRMIMLASNDYLGLTQDERVKRAAADAVMAWGTGAAGSRFVCGNFILHERLEEKLAQFLGKKKALVHTTGFGTNLGAISSLLTAQDHILADRESHASIWCGCSLCQAAMTTFKHNDLDDLEDKLAKICEQKPDSRVILITEGVFSMSGDVCPLPDFVALRAKYPNLFLYLDDAHGIGCMGPGGRGTAEHFEVSPQIDFIMGTFSKALGSIGGFLASDDETTMSFLRHDSRPLIFSAALPAANVAAVLTCLEIVQQEPWRVERLWRNTNIALKGYQRIGLKTSTGQSPVLPIKVGNEVLAGQVSRELLAKGIFAPPITSPAVRPNQGMIRTAFQSTHTREQINRVLEVLAELADKHGLNSLGD